MQIYNGKKLSDFKFWGDAKVNAKKLTDLQINIVGSIIEEIYPEGISEDDINDFFSFDFETVKEWSKIEE